MNVVRPQLKSLRGIVRVGRQRNRLPERHSVQEHRLWKMAVGSGLLLALVLSASAQSAELKPVTVPDETKRRAPVETVPASAPPLSCQAPRERAKQLLAELEKNLSPQSKTEARQYVAKPGPGVSSEKAWGDFAAGAALMGDVSLAAWAGLSAADLQWSGETVTNAGVYVFYLGKQQDALQLLTCAHAMGYRSPFLFEALATVRHKSGQAAEARQAITQANQLAPDDRLIETSASYLTTGQPPPPRPPANRSDGLDEAIRELEEHAARALNRIQAQADELDRSLPDAHGREQYAIQETYFRSLLQNARDQAPAARATDPRSRQFMINSVLGVYISMYAQITDALLSFPDSTLTFGSPVSFWADVLGLDAPLLARESRRDGVTWDMHSALGPALAQGAFDAYTRDKEQAYGEYVARERACRGNECIIREKARWCSIWKPLYERWANDSRQRHNQAARSFDRIATQTLISAENDLLLARDYAVRQVKTMRFPDTPGFDMKKMTLQGINQSVQSVFEKHLSPKTEHSGIVPYVRDRARWFEGERSGMEEQLAHEADAIKRECEPAMQALLELLIQEEWQAYLDHLRDRLAWDLQGQAETSEFPCEGTIGPVKISTDLNKPGEGKMDIKWSRKGVPVSAGGSVTVREDQTIALGVGVSVKQSREREPAPDSIDLSVKHDSRSGQGLEGSGCYGPFCGKAKVSLTSKVSPWNSREFLGIKLKGSAGLGLRKGGSMGVACYPSNGSVTFYPRALYEDTVRYLSTPATSPRR